MIFYKKLYQHKEISEEALTEVFEGFSGMISQVVSILLSRDIMKRELSMAITCMANGKAPRHHGIPIEFILKLWPIVGHDFHRIVLRGIEKGILHEGMTKGLACLIPKEGDAKDLTTTYKIFTKALQLRFQPIIKDIISQELASFLPLHFILNNIFLAQETLHWAKTCRQPTVLIKPDFLKAYDKVSHQFFFSQFK